MHRNADDLLAYVSADNRAALYRCRWSQPDAEDIVPALAQLLHASDRTIVVQALNALHCIGPAARASIPNAIPLLDHPDTVVREAAITTLAQVGLDTPAGVLPHLLAASARPEHLVTLLFAFINLATPSPEALPFVCQAFEHPKGHVRRLALRALAAINAPNSVLAPILQRATSDPNADVRSAAAKLSQRSPTAT